MSSPADQPAPGVGSDPSVVVRVEQLYADHAALVRSICRSLLRNRPEAEDAAQQTFLSAQQALANGTSPLDGAAWIATIARHECLARMRARMREPLPLELTEADSVPDAHTASVRRHEADELRRALAELPAQQREAILLREVRGLSYLEVASSLSVTTSAVESLLFRARRSLQRRLRGGRAAISVGWLPSLREFALRFGDGGAVGPTAVKAAAVGVGTALFAGGAIAPTMIGLGRAPNPIKAASRPAAQHTVHAARLEAPVRFKRPLSRVRLPEGGVPTIGVSNATKISDAVRSSSGSESEGSTSTGAHHDDGGDNAAASNRVSRSADDSSGSDDGSSDDSRSSTATTDTTTTSTATTGTTTTPTTTVTTTTTDD